MLFIIALNLIFYFRTLRFGYVCDDVGVSAKEPKGNRLQRLWGQFRGESYYNSQTVHLFSYVLHTLNCSLIYLVFGGQIGLIAALLFTVNPITSQAGVWPSGRGYCISSILILTSFLYKPLFPIFYIYTIWWSSASIVTPILFDWWSWILFPIYWKITFWKPSNKAQLDYRKTITNVYHRVIDIGKLIFVTKCFAYYTQLCLLPRRLGIQHNFFFNYGESDKDNKEAWRLDRWFWSGLVVGLGCLYLIITDLYGLRFPILWYSSSIIIWCNWVTHQQIIGERYCYFATIGLMVAVAKVLMPYPYLLVALFTYYAFRNQQQLNSYKNDVLNVEYNLYDINFRDHYFVWSMKGNIHALEGRIYPALDAYLSALHIRNDPHVNFKTAMLLAKIAKFDEAEAHLKLVEEAQFYDVPTGVTSGIETLRNMMKDAKKRLKKEGKL